MRQELERKVLRNHERDVLYAVENHPAVFVSGLSHPLELLDILSRYHKRIVLVRSTRRLCALSVSVLDTWNPVGEPKTRTDKTVLERRGVQLQIVDADLQCFQLSSSKMWENALYVVCDTTLGFLSVDLAVQLLKLSQTECNSKVVVPQMHESTLANKLFESAPTLRLGDLGVKPASKMVLSRPSNRLAQDDIASCLADSPDQKVLVFVPSYEITDKVATKMETFTFDLEKPVEQLCYLETLKACVLFVVGDPESVQILHDAGLGAVFDLAIDCATMEREVYDGAIQRETLTASKELMFSKTMAFQKLRRRDDADYVMLISKNTKLLDAAPERNYKFLVTSLWILRRCTSEFLALPFVRSLPAARVAAALTELNSLRLQEGVPLCIPVNDPSWAYMIACLEYASRNFPSVAPHIARLTCLVYAFDQHHISSRFKQMCQRINDRDMAELRAKESDFLTLLNWWNVHGRGHEVQQGVAVAREYTKQLCTGRPLSDDTLLILQCLAFGFLTNRGRVREVTVTYNEWITTIEVEGTAVDIREPRKPVQLFNSGDTVLWFRERGPLLGIYSPAADVLEGAKSARYGHLRASLNI